jgi:hypothetical protein
MPVLGGQRGLGAEERGLDHQHVGVRGEVVDALAQAGVHHEREDLTRPRGADLVEADDASVGPGDPALALQLADLRPAHARLGELLREHPTSVRLGDAVAVGVHAV